MFESESGEDDEQNVQLADIDIDHSGEFFAANEQGMAPLGVEYVRTLPSQWDEQSNEKFMHKVLDEYAIEKKTATGTPTGIFRMNKPETMRLATVIITKTKHFDKPAEADSYIKENFKATWDHFDVN